MFQPDDQRKIEQELARGEAARRQGLEGRARVCARRAAGLAIRAYLERRGAPLPGSSAMDLLLDFQARPGLTPEVRQVIEHLVTRVDEEFALPVEADLLAEVRWLVMVLQEPPDADIQREEE